MPVPKRKTSKARRNKRLTHYKTEAPNLSTCSQCGDAKLPHHACPGCGAYKGRSIFETEED